MYLNETALFKLEEIVSPLLIGAGAIGTHVFTTSVLPKMLGLRTEYHVTPKSNYKNIKKTGYLDPSYGGKNGAGEHINSNKFKQNSKNFVHITGNPYTNGMSIKDRIRSNLDSLYMKALLNTDKKYFEKNKDPNYWKKGLKIGYLKSLIPFLDNTKRLVIMEPKENFKQNFEPDPDTFNSTLRTQKPVKIYSNKYQALYNNLLKKFNDVFK